MLYLKTDSIIENACGIIGRMVCAFTLILFTALSDEAPVGADNLELSGGKRVNILELQPQPCKDYTKVLNDTFHAGKTAFLPAKESPYIVAGSLEFDVPGAGLAGEAGTQIAYTGKTTMLRIKAANITFNDITFDSARLGYADKPEAYCLSPNFKWSGGGMRFCGPFFLQPGSDGAQLSNLKCDYCSASAIAVQSNRVSVTNCEFQNNRGFGIIADVGARNFSFKENHGNGNGIEIIAVKHGASDGEIANNKLMGSGDNGISISGERVRVTGNIVKNSLGHGIAVYGDNNLVSDNQVIDNAQVDNPAAPAILQWNNTRKAVYHSPGYAFGGKYDGIKIIAAFGGHGSHNTVVNNVVVDNQPKPTQGGIEIGPNSPDNTVANNKVGRHR